MSTPANTPPHAVRGQHIVYHLVALLPGIDAEDALASVYIGVTSDLHKRLKDHARKWWWVAVRLDHSEFSMHDTRAEAEAYERDMIEFYQPAMNKMGRLMVIE